MGGTPLEELVLRPTGGLGNRMRAIASARRVAERAGARLALLWDWGDYRALFDDDTEWRPLPPADPGRPDALVPGWPHLRHLLDREGGSDGNRRVPLGWGPRLVLESCYAFRAASEPEPKTFERDVFEWFPRPHASILERVEAFRRERLPPRTAGIHMRRTDHERVRNRSPDRAYRREADRLVARGHPLFLATDDPGTVDAMRRRYGDRLLHFPKADAAAPRWPRPAPDVASLREDLVDLWLLGACDPVIGSAHSSFSRVAALICGSPRCVLIDRREPWAARTVRRWRRRFGGGRRGRDPAEVDLPDLPPGALARAQAAILAGGPDLYSDLERGLAEAREETLPPRARRTALLLAHRLTGLAFYAAAAAALAPADDGPADSLVLELVRRLG